MSVNSHGTGENGPRYLIADFSQLIDETDTCSLIEGCESQTLYLELRPLKRVLDMKEFHITELRGHYNQNKFSEMSPKGTNYPRELKDGVKPQFGSLTLYYSS